MTHRNKTVIITGANRGLGFETAKVLAGKGYEVIMLGRNEQELKKAQWEISNEFKEANTHVFIADLSNFNSVTQCCEHIKASFSKIDVLINNAGAVFADFGLTQDGLERTIAVNHFSYFLICYHLLPLLKNAGAARIVNVASHSHYPGKIDFESFTKNKGYFIMKAYEQSKLANVLFTYALAEKLKNTSITVNALHPGRVDTQIGIKNQPWHVALFWKVFTSISSVSVQKGAETQIFLATDTSVEGITGKYFARCKEVKSSRLSYDKILADKLWEETERLSGVNFEL